MFEREIESLLKQLFKNSEKTFEEILAFVNENVCDVGLSLDMVADYSNISKSKLSKLFYAKMGVHYLEYITEHRMNKASELIRTTDVGIKEIFQQVGYNDYTNAGNNFRKKFGMKPSEYRNLYKGENKHA